MLLNFLTRSRCTLSARVFHLFVKGHHLVLSLSSGQVTFALSAAVTLLSLGVKYSGLLQPLELRAFDQMVQLQGNREVDERLLVVEITEADLRMVKVWPIPDITLAQALETLQQHHPQVIGLDVYRDMPQPPGYPDLQQQLKAPNLFTITKLPDAETDSISPPPGVGETRIGFNDAVLDPDGVIRRNLLYGTLDEQPFYSLGLRVSLHYLKSQGLKQQPLKLQGDPLPSSIALGKVTLLPLPPGAGGYERIDNGGFQLLQSYRAETIARHISLGQVLKKDFDPAWVRDKIVLIGTTAPSINDFFLTPYSSSRQVNPQMPGVLIQAHFISNLIQVALGEQQPFRFLPEWGEVLWIVGWSGLAGFLVYRVQNLIMLSVIGSLGLVGLGATGFLLFTQSVWLPLTAPAFGFVAVGLSTLIYRYVRTAFRDPLTGLPNRNLLLQRLQATIHHSPMGDRPGMAIILLRLDQLLDISDCFGETVGDYLLIAIIHQLQETLQNGEILTRTGTDELAILIREAKDLQQVIEVADRIRAQASKSYQYREQTLYTRVSTGIALERRKPNYGPTELLQDAHTALHLSHQGTQLQHHGIYSRKMREPISHELRMEGLIRQGLENHHFLLHYHPIVRLSTGEILGFEALVRLANPEGGLIPPIKFIPVAEKSGLIVPLGEWVLREACRQAQYWHTRFTAHAPLFMSVNLSPQQFYQTDIVQSVERVLKETGFSNQSLKLEITESSMMDNVQETLSLLHQLKALNVGLSIDDFGTGYSSLFYLRDFPVDVLKIDRSFINELGKLDKDEEIVQTIITLGNTLDLEVVAEGVETEWQQAKLISMKCEYGQGYLFSKPLDSVSATALLENGQSSRV